MIALNIFTSSHVKLLFIWKKLWSLEQNFHSEWNQKERAKQILVYKRHEEEYFNTFSVI